LVSRQRAENLHQCRRLLLPLLVAAALASAAPSASSAATTITPAALPHCPRCGGCRFLKIELPKEAGLPLAWCEDTSWRQTVRDRHRARSGTAVRYAVRAATTRRRVGLDNGLILARA